MGIKDNNTRTSIILSTHFEKKNLGAYREIQVPNVHGKWGMKMNRVREEE